MKSPQVDLYTKLKPEASWNSRQSIKNTLHCALDNGKPINRLKYAKPKTCDLFLWAKELTTQVSLPSRGRTALIYSLPPSKVFGRCFVKVSKACVNPEPLPSPLSAIPHILHSVDL